MTKDKNMTKRAIFRTLIILLILISNFGCDQISKNLVRQNINYHEKISVIDPYFTLTKVENTGAFLSFGVEFPPAIKLVLLTILPLVIIVLALIYILTKQQLSKYRVLGIILIMGGGLGNIYDRIVFGSVTDFLRIDFILFKTGIFNIADASVMAGIFLIFLESFLHKEPTNEAATL